MVRPFAATAASCAAVSMPRARPEMMVKPACASLIGKLLRRLRAVVRRPPRADDADGVFVARLEFPPDIEQQRRIVGVPQRGGVVLVILGHDGNAALGGFADLRGGIGVVLPGVEDFRRLLADAVHPHQPVLGRAEDGRRIAEMPPATAGRAPGRSSAAC